MVQAETSVYNDVVQSSSNGSGTGAKFRVTTDGSSTFGVEIIDGGTGHVEGNTITINGSSIGWFKFNIYVFLFHG